MSVVDTSTTPAPTYTLTPSAATINEGAVLTSTVATTNVATGTKFYYALSGTGIATADFSAGALTGEGITDATGKFSFSHILANDRTTEGAETLSIKLFSDDARKVQVGTTATVSVADTSAASITWITSAFPRPSAAKAREILDFTLANDSAYRQTSKDAESYAISAAFAMYNDNDKLYNYYQGLIVSEQVKAKSLEGDLNKLLTTDKLYSIGSTSVTSTVKAWIPGYYYLAFDTEVKIAYSDNGDGIDKESLNKTWNSTTIYYGGGNDSVTTENSVTEINIALDEGDDTYQGENGIDRVNGGKGNDKIEGFGGNDVLDGGDDDDSVDGGIGDDLSGGSIGNDLLYGKDGNDLIFGEDGNDQLNGGEGDDLLDGGEGNDTATYQGNFNDYQITFDNSLLKIIDLTSDRDGSDTLTRIEYIKFNDITKTVIQLPGAPPTLTITPSTTAINEGATLNTSVATNNVASGTTLYYSLSGTGITAADLSAGSLIGEGITDSTGKFTFTHTLANDLTTEGAETVELKLFSDEARKVQVGSTATVSIADTSTTPLPQVSVIATANGKETDGSPAVFNFSRTGDTNTALIVSYQLFGTAQAGSDYIGNTTGMVSFAAGSSTATLSLPALADGALIDPYETIIARITPATNYGIETGKQFATATITAEGMVVTPKGANYSYLGNSSGEKRNDYAFAALKSDGSVISWGTYYDGKAITSPAGLTGVSQIFSNGGSFAALKSDGSVVSWGGGDAAKSPAGLMGVSQIFSTGGAFAALKSDGTVVSWGNVGRGNAGSITNLITTPVGLTGVSQIFSHGYAFAALKSDGGVVSWGTYWDGLKYDEYPTSSTVPVLFNAAPVRLTGVTQIFSTDRAFAVLKSDSSVISWGDKDRGGVAPEGLTGVSQIFSNIFAFAALKSDGSVVCWGDSRYGGSAPTVLTGVSQIFSNAFAFSALKSDGSVVCWGEGSYGGNAPAGLAGVIQIFSTSSAFAALKSDGSVVCWGEGSYGGNAPAGLTGVSQIFSTGYAFAALKTDGSVIAGVKAAMEVTHQQG